MPFDPTTVAVPFRMQPGLRKVESGTAPVHASPCGGPVFSAKLAALRKHTDQCLVAAPGADARPALEVLAQAAAAACPEALRADGAWLRSDALALSVRLEDGHWQAGARAQAQAAGLLESLPAEQRAGALASLALVEDFALIDAATATLPWMAVCLPSHWDPREKVGRSFADVHAPVAESAMVQQAGAHLLRLVSAPGRWERFVWTVTTHPDHDQHPARHTRRAWPAEAGPQDLLTLATFRTERQGFLPLPGRQQALFTIEVEVRPLIDALDGPRALDAQRLHDALASMSEAVLAYRSLTTARDRLCAALRERHGLPDA